MKIWIRVTVAICLFTQSAMATHSRADYVASQLQSEKIVQNLETWARLELTQQELAAFQKQKPALVQYKKILSKMKIKQTAQSIALNVEGVQPIEISWARESEGFLVINQTPVHFADKSFSEIHKEILSILETKKAWQSLLLPEAQAGAYLILGVAAVVALAGIVLYSKGGKRQLTNMDEKFETIRQACEKRDPAQPFYESETAKLFNEFSQYDKNKDLFLTSKEADKKGSSCTSNLSSGARLGQPELIRSVCDKMQLMLACVRQYQEESLEKHGSSSVSQESAAAAQ